MSELFILIALGIAAVSGGAAVICTLRRRRRRDREDCRRQARELIVRMRVAVERDQRDEKRKAQFNASRLRLLCRRGGSTLTELGLGQQALDRLLALSKDEAPMNAQNLQLRRALSYPLPVAPVRDDPGTMDLQRVAERAGAKAGTTAAAEPTEAAAAMPSGEAMFTANDDGDLCKVEVDEGESGVEGEIIIDLEPSEPMPWDPRVALRQADQRELEAFVDDGFDRMLIPK